MRNQNTLPSLPLKQEIESKKVSKKIVSANIALAELKGAVKSIPNQSILINALSLQEAKDSLKLKTLSPPMMNSIVRM